jgi:hypothetical protein
MISVEKKLSEHFQRAFLSTDVGVVGVTGVTAGMGVVGGSDRHRTAVTTVCGGNSIRRRSPIGV